MSEQFGRVAIISSLASLGGLIWLWAWFYSGQPTIDKDYITVLNAGIDDIPMKDRAWNIYRESWIRHEFSEGAKGRFEEIHYRNEGADDDYRLVRPSDGTQWKRAIAKLEQSQDLLAALREGGKKTKLGIRLVNDPSDHDPEDLKAMFPGRSPDEPFDLDIGIAGLSEEASRSLEKSLIGVLLPHIQSLRKAARILHVDSRWAMEQGDTERAIRNTEAVFGLASQASERPILVCSLVGMAIHQMGCDQIDELVALHGAAMSESDLKRLQRAVTRDDIRSFVRFDGEQAMFEDLLQRLFTNDGNGDGRITPVGLEILRKLPGWLVVNGESTEPDVLTDGVLRVAAPMSIALIPTRKQYSQKYEEILSDIQSHFFEPFHSTRLDDIEAKIDGLGERYLLLTSFLCSFDQIRHSMYRTIGNQGGTAMGLAVLRYEKVHGTLPETTDPLISRYLTSIPLDPLHGQPFRYIRENGRFKVYGLGADGDDDQGRAIRSMTDGSLPAPGTTRKGNDGVRPMKAAEFHFTLQGRADLDGDWVVWPRFADQ